MPWVAAVAAVAGSAISSSGAKSAANTQADAAQAASDQQMQMFQQSQANVAPYLNAGTSSLSQLMSGLSPAGSISTMNVQPDHRAQDAMHPYGSVGATTSNSSVPVSSTGTGAYLPTNFAADDTLRTIGTAGLSNQMTNTLGLNRVKSPEEFKAYQDYVAQNPYTQRGDFTMDKFHEDPGYQFQLQQGLNTLTNASSLSGGMNSNNLKGLLGFSQGLANQDYQQAFSNYQTEAGRDLGEYQTNLNDYIAQFLQGQNVTSLNNKNIQDKFNNNVTKTNVNNNAAQAEYQAQLAQLAFNNQAKQSDFNNGITTETFNNNVRANTLNQNNANKQLNFSNLSSLANMGLSAGLGQMGNSTAVGNSIGSNIVGAGNAQAAGTMGAANAWGNGIGQGYNAYLQNQAMQNNGNPYGSMGISGNNSSGYTYNNGWDVGPTQ